MLQPLSYSILVRCDGVPLHPNCYQYRRYESTAVRGLSRSAFVAKATDVFEGEGFAFLDDGQTLCASCATAYRFDLFLRLKATNLQIVKWLRYGRPQFQSGDRRRETLAAYYANPAAPIRITEEMFQGLVQEFGLRPAKKGH